MQYSSERIKWGPPAIGSGPRSHYILCRISMSALSTLPIATKAFDQSRTLDDNVAWFLAFTTLVMLWLPPSLANFMSHHRC